MAYGRVFQYDLNGDFIAEYQNGKAAAKLTNGDHSTLYACLRGEQLTHNNSYWSYKCYIKLPKELMSKHSKVYQYDDQMKLIRIYDRAEDTVQYGFDNSSVLRCLKGKLRLHKGFIWKYKN
jgi:hypothetical protein